MAKQRAASMALCAALMALCSMGHSQEGAVFGDPLNWPRFEPSSARPNDLAGLKLHDRGERVRHLQAILRGRWLGTLVKRRTWLANIPSDPAGRFEENTYHLLTLYRAVYGTVRNGPATMVDETTAAFLLAMEDKTFWNPNHWENGRIPEKSPGGRILYYAAQYLGAPYVFGGDGAYGIDCGMLVKTALEDAKIWPRGSALSRNAYYQQRYAIANENRLTLVRERESPPWDIGALVFFNWPTAQTWDCPGCVSHVGLALGEVPDASYRESQWPLTLEAVGAFVSLGPRNPAAYVAGTATAD